MDEDIKDRLGRIETKLDRNQDLVWGHITSVSQNIERLDGKINSIELEQKWFKRIAVGFATFTGAVITWVIQVKK